MYYLCEAIKGNTKIDVQTNIEIIFVNFYKKVCHIENKHYLCPTNTKDLKSLIFERRKKFKNNL